MSHFYRHHERQAKRGPIEIHSLLLDYITQKPPRNCMIFPTAALVKTEIILGEISGSHGDEYKNDCLLGCCAL
jgi:hypothetical protein